MTFVNKQIVANEIQLDFSSKISHVLALSNSNSNCKRRFKMIEQLIDCIKINWFRMIIISVSVACLVHLLVKKYLERCEFRRKVDLIPGPITRDQLLGNIPSQVLSLLIPFKNSNETSKLADQFYLSQIQSLLGHTQIYRDQPIFRLWLGQEPIICVWKAAEVEQVLNDSFLLEKSYHYDFLRPWLGDGLLTSPGRIWRARRKLLVPSFHFNILRAFVPVFDRKSKLMVRNLNRRLSDKCIKDYDEGTIVDITPIITACTLDAICETIMGVSIDAQECPDNDYCESIYIVGETFLERIIQPRYWIDWIFERTELGKLYNYHLQKLHSFTRRVIAEKKAAYANATRGSQNKQHEPTTVTSNLTTKLKVLEQGSVDSYVNDTTTSNKNSAEKEQPKLPKAFLDLLLDKVMLANRLQEQQPQQAQLRIMSDEDIREEVDTFMFEGHDTTAMALSWTLFLLGHNQQVQRKLQSEIDKFYELKRDECLNDDDGTYLKLNLDHLKELKYLDCVIKEALRLCPSVPFIGRKTTNELRLANYKIPPGCVIFLLIYQLHRNPEIFPNPEKFDPDRFMAQNTLGRHPFAYVPFSAGPRNCIGQKFAMAEMKTILLHLIRNFSFESITPLEKAEVRMEMVLRPKQALNIRVKTRNNEH